MTTHSDVLDLAAFRRVMEMHYINANTLTTAHLGECYALIKTAVVDGAPINLTTSYGLAPSRYLTARPNAAYKIYVTYHTLVKVLDREAAEGNSSLEVNDMRTALATYFRDVSSLPDWFILVVSDWVLSVTDASPLQPCDMILAALGQALDPAPSDNQTTLPKLCGQVTLLYYSLVRSRPKPLILPMQLEFPTPVACQAIDETLDYIKAHAVVQVLPPIASLEQAKLVAIFDAIKAAPTTGIPAMHEAVERVLPTRVAVVQVHRLLAGYEMIRRKEMLHLHQVMAMPAKYGSHPTRGITSILWQESFDRDYVGLAGALTIVRMANGRNLLSDLELHCTSSYTDGKLEHCYELVDISGSDHLEIGFRPTSIPALVARATLLGRLREKAAPALGVPIPGLPKKAYLVDLLKALDVVGLLDDRPYGSAECYLDAGPYLDAFINHMEHLYKQEILLGESLVNQQRTF